MKPEGFNKGEEEEESTEHIDPLNNNNNNNNHKSDASSVSALIIFSATAPKTIRPKIQDVSSAETRVTFNVNAHDKTTADKITEEEEVKGGSEGISEQLEPEDGMEDGKLKSGHRRNHGNKTEDLEEDQEGDALECHLKRMIISGETKHPCS